MHKEVSAKLTEGASEGQLAGLTIQEGAGLAGEGIKPPPEMAKPPLRNS